MATLRPVALGAACLLASGPFACSPATVGPAAEQSRGPFALHVSRTGSGTVTSSPPGISCGSTCAATFASGTTVTLTASAPTGFTLAGWSGNGISCPGTGPCTVAMSVGRNVMARFMSSTSTDPCNGLVTDKLAHPMSALAKPTKGAPFVDPEFGTTVRRITNVAADLGMNVAKPSYSTVPAWNADESYLILYVTGGGGGNTGHHLYDGRTYAYLRALDIQPTDVEHFVWSSTDPDVLFYTQAGEQGATSIRRIVRYHVSTGQKDALYEIPNATLAGGSGQVDMGGDPIYTSWDNDLFGLRRVSNAQGNTGFTYRVSTGGESPRASGNAPHVAPTGTLYVFGNSVYDAATNAVVRALHSSVAEHGDMTMLANGHDVWVSVQFDVAPYGTVVVEDLTTGAVTVVIGGSTGFPYPPTGTHLSGHAFGRPGWIGVSVTGNTSGAGVLDQELLLVDVNTGSFCRVAHHRSAGGNGPNGYWSEPHVNISPSGTRLLFGSDWGGGATVDAYVVELPSYRR